MITGRLELLRRHLATPEQQARFDQALVAAKRIAEIIAHMGQITRLETQPGAEVSPMLDLRRSGRRARPCLVAATLVLLSTPDEVVVSTLEGWPEPPCS